MAERVIHRGIWPDRVVCGGTFVVPDGLFTSDGQKLDIVALRADAGADPESSDLV